MKNWKKYASLLLALIMCLSMAACGGKISIKDLEGYWYPVEGIGSTTSVLTCIYVDGSAGTWEEYDQYGDPTGYTGGASTDGEVLTLTDVPLIGEVAIPVGDADTLVTDTGETYWIKGVPDFMEKPVVAPATIENIVIDDSVEYDYSGLLGTWSGEYGSVLAVEMFDDGRAHFTFSDANGDWVAAGIFQYAKEYDRVYAHNDYDGIAYMCSFDDDGTMHIESFCAFVKVSDDVPGETSGDNGADLSVLTGSWLLDNEPDAKTTIAIDDGNWILWEQEEDGMWGMADGGTINALGDGQYEAVSTINDGKHDLTLFDGHEMYWDGYYFEKSE